MIHMLQSTAAMFKLCITSSATLVINTQSWHTSCSSFFIKAILLQSDFLISNLVKLSARQ